MQTSITISGDEASPLIQAILGAAVGAFTIGAATNEGARQGVDETKRRRLIAAGADVIVGDFGDVSALMTRLGF